MNDHLMNLNHSQLNCQNEMAQSITSTLDDSPDLE